ncbi:MAG: winged helix-turn-helix transcriptional regulator [Mycobacteriaceae bacterium]
MPVILEEDLHNLDDWNPVGQCAIEDALEVVHSRTSLLFLREAYYGTTKFHDFARRVGVTDAATSTRLKALVEQGLLTKHPYREQGRRARDEYLLTAKGEDLAPAVFALMQWGDRYCKTGRVELVEAKSGQNIMVGLIPENVYHKYAKPLGKITLRLRKNRK